MGDRIMLERRGFEPPVPLTGCVVSFAEGKVPKGRTGVSNRCSILAGAIVRIRVPPAAILVRT
jgi:hypothetical protein